MIRLLIVDDQTAVRQALEVMLGLVDDLDVVGTAANGQLAVELAADLHPEVVLMDLNMPVMGGAEATEKILALDASVSVVILTTFDDDESILAALRAGALGYLTKDADHLQIAQAVRSARVGQSVLDPDVQVRLLRLASRSAAGGAAAASGGEAGPSLLTQREKEILGLIGAGLRNRDIADALTISEATVKTHINNIFAKADLHSRADAVRYALTVGQDAPEFGR
jgi:DNA-binding NarL/FixJ family response regulator